MTGVTPYRQVKPEADPAERQGVGPDLTSLPRTTACPACGGALRPEATWCSLCFFDFRSATTDAAPGVPAPEPLALVPAPAYGGPDPLTAPLLDLAMPLAAPQASAPAVATNLAAPAVEPDSQPAGQVHGHGVQPTWPCARCEASNPLDAMACLVCGSRFLDDAAEKPSLVLPGVGDLYTMSRGRRAGVATAVVMAVLLPFMIMVLLMTGGSTTSKTPTTSETTIPTVTSQ